jgi:hypothetical protein
VKEQSKSQERAEVLRAVKMSVVVFWVVTPNGLVGGCQRVGGTYSLQLKP